MAGRRQAGQRRLGVAIPWPIRHALANTGAASNRVSWNGSGRNTMQEICGKTRAICGYVHKICNYMSQICKEYADIYTK